MQQNGRLCFQNGKPICCHPLGYRSAVNKLFGGPLAAPAAPSSTIPVASTSQGGFLDCTAFDKGHTSMTAAAIVEEVEEEEEKKNEEKSVDEENDEEET